MSRAGVRYRMRTDGAMWAIALMLSCSSAAAQDIVVDPSGPVRTLTKAIAVARPGARIVVKPGVYREPTIRVDKRVRIVGEGYPVFDGEGERQIITVVADSVEIRGLTLRNVGTSFVEDQAAVKVDGAHHCVIADNRLENTFFGIYLAKASYCRITGNSIRGEKLSESQSGNGIHLWYCRNILIADNEIYRHRDGIYFEFVEDSEIIGNHSESNLRYGLHFMFSDRCRYQNNLFKDNDAGVAVMYTKNVLMIQNRFELNWGSAAYGLLLKDITDSDVLNNRFYRNTTGLYSEGSNRVNVEGNAFVENGWAVKIMANSENNTITRNNFIGNSFAVATNSRASYSTFRENYWDEYQGYDMDRNGYGDVPFRPVRLFSYLVEHNEPSLILMRSLFIDLLDIAERIIPSLTPETLVDDKPLMKPVSIPRPGS